MADSNTPKQPTKTPTVEETRDDRSLRANADSWKQKITPTISDQIPDATREIPGAAQQVPLAVSYIDQAMAATVSGDESSTSNSDQTKQGGNGKHTISTLLAGLSGKKTNSKGRSTASTLTKSAKDLKQVVSPTKAVEKTVEHEKE